MSFEFWISVKNLNMHVLMLLENKTLTFHVSSYRGRGWDIIKKFKLVTVNASKNLTLEALLTYSSLNLQIKVIHLEVICLQLQ